MRFLSVCSGIEAASVAWTPLGFQAVAFAEIDAFPCAVLAQHYPDVPNRGDMSRFQEWPDADVDVFVGGTPCQSFSVAGLRKGLSDPRGNLALTYLAILDRYRPRWCCWENVPGVLSADGGRAMGAFLGGLAELGYGFAYRVLDAQYFGLAQRRQRVFVVGHLGSWACAAAVLFERASLSGHPAPRRETGQVAPTIPSRRVAGGGLGTDFDCDGGLIPLVAFDTTQITSAANYSHPKPGDPCHPLAAGAHPPAVAFAQNQRDEVRMMDVAGALAGEPGMKQQTFVGCAMPAVAFDARQSDVIQYGYRLDSSLDPAGEPSILVIMRPEALECLRRGGVSDRDILEAVEAKHQATQERP